MSGIPFQDTRAGRKLLDGTLPEIAKQLAALVRAVERLADAVEARGLGSEDPDAPEDADGEPA